MCKRSNVAEKETIFKTHAISPKLPGTAGYQGPRGTRDRGPGAAPGLRTKGDGPDRTKKFLKINFSFSKVHKGAEPIRTKEQIRHINGVRSTTNSCMEKYTEQQCLRALFDNAYFWNKWFYTYQSEQCHLAYMSILNGPLWAAHIHNDLEDSPVTPINRPGHLNVILFLFWKISAYYFN